MMLSFFFFCWLLVVARSFEAPLKTSYSSLKLYAQFGGRTGCCVKADSYLETLSSARRPKEPSEAESWHLDWVALLDASLRKRRGKGLPIEGVTQESCEALFKSESLVVVSHDTLDGPEGPIFNYATQAALKLWELDWTSFVKLPSRYSAEEDERAQRAIFMDAVKKNGYCDNYNGIRVSSTGKRFRINDVIIWNVDDKEGHLTGQAAMFHLDDVLFL